MQGIGSNLSPRITNKSNQTNQKSSNQTNLKGCSISGKSKFWGGLHNLVIREHSSRSVVSDIDLCYVQ